jgi:hypothetical protein
MTQKQEKQSNELKKVKVIRTGHKIENADLIYSCCRKTQRLTID